MTLYAHLVEIEHQIQFAHIPKELIQNLNEKVYSLQVRQLVVIRIYASAEEESRISPVYNLTAATELDEVGLVFLIARRNKTVNLALELNLLVVIVRAIPLRKAGFASDPCVSGA